MAKRKKDFGLITSIIFLFVGLILLFFPFYILDGVSIGNWEIQTKRYGELGGFISGVSAPFLSISAFILLYLTYKSQKQELSESRKILKQQNETIDKQQFETTFFNLLNLHYTSINSINVTITNKKSSNGVNSETAITKTGKDSFITFYTVFKIFFDEETQKNKYTQIPELLLIIQSYNIFHHEFKQNTEHYFKNLLHIIYFIKLARIKNKEQYISIIIAQLSHYELMLLFYYGISKFGNEFKPLIEEFHLLKNIDATDLISQKHLEEYKKSAYIKEQ